MNSENSTVSPPLNIEKCSVVVVDIAGTTTSTDFVKNTLFSFTTQKAEEFLRTNWEKEEVKEILNLLKEEADLNLEKAVEKVKKLTEENSNNKGLKNLQGLIYKEGYEKGDLKAHIFDDVFEAFESWSKSRKIAIYSTGSIESQKLLFAHTVKGDITAHINKYFDQSVGSKIESESYKKIAKDVEVEPEDIVFITNDPKEAAAAKSGGLTAVLVKREGNEEISEEVAKEFTVISSFKDIQLEKASKRKIEEEPTAEEAPPTKVAKTDEEKVEDTKQTEEKNTEESMEIDTPIEQTETKDMTKTAPEETEKPAETATEQEKTETKENAVTEMKEVEADTKEKKEEPEENPEVSESVEEAAKSEETSTVVAEKKVEEKTTATESTIKEPEIEKITSDETKAIEEKTATVENKTEVTETKEKKLVPEEAQKVAEEETATADTKAEDAKELKEETKLEEEKTTTGDAKEEVKTVEVEETPAEEQSTENGDTAETVEKENKSVLANGLENGKDEEGVESSAAETVESKPEETETEEVDEVKVKKLEESAESKTVSVEV